MTRILAISLSLLVLLLALTAYIVFGQRRSFDHQDQIVFEMGGGADNYNLYSIQPTSSLGARMKALFLPSTVFGDRVTGIDCAPNSSSLIFWYIYLYRLNLADSSLTPLTLGTGLSEQSVWSPDGSRIAYLDDVADRQPREVFVIDADGTHKRRVTTNDLKETSLAWSPDGQQIAFTFVRGDDPSREGLAVVSVASGAATTLYETAADVNSASWSPDGTHIAFTIGSANRIDIYTVQPNGTSMTRLSGQLTDNVFPRWSPDGTMISYSARDPGQHYQLYVMGQDGSNPYLVFVGYNNMDVLNRCWLKS
ncbi:MAG TPA: hypothetical protein VHD90_20830 [Phototrophicaceae bacterium]|nr:hypothetical protein [Phototrophicaceae bacterium]